MQCKYLGFHLKAGKTCLFDYEPSIRSFYRATNSILRSHQKPNQNVLMHLLYSNCMPILTWGSEVKEYADYEFSQMSTAVNSAIRQIFYPCYWQTVSQIREGFRKPSLSEIFSKSKQRFHASLLESANILVRNLFLLQHDPYW